MIDLGRINKLRRWMRGEKVEPVILMVKTEVMDELMASPVWAARLEAAKTTAERIKVVKAYGRAQGMTIRDVDLDDKNNT